MLKKQSWLITREQIEKLRIDDAILPVDPEQMCDAEIFGLRGAVRLRIEGVHGPADLFAQPRARKFFQALHQRWPFAAYFLKVNPIDAHSSLDQVIDLSLFMGLCLCHVDRMSFMSTARGSVLKYDGNQLEEYLSEITFRAADLAGAVDFPATEIARRDLLISRSVASFFKAGEALHQKTKNQRNNK